MSIAFLFHLDLDHCEYLDKHIYHDIPRSRDIPYIIFSIRHTKNMCRLLMFQRFSTFTHMDHVPFLLHGALRQKPKGEGVTSMVSK